MIQPSKTIAIVFHSNYGYTRRVASVIQNVANPIVPTRLIDVVTISDDDWAYMDNADMIVYQQNCKK